MPEERWRRETSAKVEYILVEVVVVVVEVVEVVDKVVVEKKMRVSRKTFEDFLFVGVFSF